MKSDNLPASRRSEAQTQPTRRSGGHSEAPRAPRVAPGLLSSSKRLVSGLQDFHQHQTPASVTVREDAALISRTLCWATQESCSHP